jgi:hypothetical protein
MCEDVAMVPTFGGIELLDDERRVASGAAFNLDRASRGDGSVTMGGLTYEVRRNGHVVVARGGSDSSYEGARDSALEHVQEVLDLWSIAGVDDLAITRVEEGHLAWWPSAVGLTVRIVSIVPVHMRFRAEFTATHSDGTTTGRHARTTLAWHPSYRYFRLSQASTDLFDAYRNAYLALESLMSSVAPQRLRRRGDDQNERDTAWLRRALATAGGLISLSDFAPPGTPDPVESIFQDLYAGTRSATFHAKAGRAVLLPRDADSRTMVASSLDRLVRVYLALAEAHLGARRPRSGLSAYAARASSSAILSEMVIWASDDESPVDPADRTMNPSGGQAVQLLAGEAADTRVPFLTTKLAAGTADDLRSLRFVRRAAGVTRDGTLMMTDLLEERLVLGSATRLEVVFGLRHYNEGPRVDYPA